MPQTLPGRKLATGAVDGESEFAGDTPEATGSLSKGSATAGRAKLDHFAPPSAWPLRMPSTTLAGHRSKRPKRTGAGMTPSRCQSQIVVGETPRARASSLRLTMRGRLGSEAGRVEVDMGGLPLGLVDAA